MLIQLEVQMQLAIVNITVLIYPISQEFLNGILDQQGIAKCLNPLKSWTKFEKQFCNNLNLGYEKHKTKIYAGRSFVDYSGSAARRAFGDLPKIQSFAISFNQMESPVFKQRSFRIAEHI